MIYFKGGNKAKTVEELLLNGFSYPRCSIYKFQPTYKNKNMRGLQCKGARRSFKDLVAIVKTYFPKATKEQIAFVLVNDIPFIRAFHCCSTGLLVFMVDKTNVDPLFVNENSDMEEEDIHGISFNTIQNLAIKYAKNRNKRQIY